MAFALPEVPRSRLYMDDMSEASTTLHEKPDGLSDETTDLHRGRVSLQEELEAVDWYRQRANACTDPELRGILEHNMREEIEHASMLLEWLPRGNPDFARHLATYLDSTGDIPAVEEAATFEADTVRSKPASQVTESGTSHVETFTVGPMKEER